MTGSNSIILVKDRCSTYNITTTGKYLYYQIDNLEKSKICRLNFETKKTDILLEGYYKQIQVTENNVFFKDYDNTNTYLVSADGNPKISTFNPPNLGK